MYRSIRLLACLLAAAALLLAQDDIPPAAGGGAPGRGGGAGGRGGGRGGTREFLGLGPAPDAAASARGEKLYAPTCGFCHGDKARGASGPNLVRSQIVLDDEKGELIGPVISQGRPDKGMPAFASFTKDQLYDIGQFLHMQVELVANRGLYKRLNVVTGDAKAGEPISTAPAAARTVIPPPATWPKSAPATRPNSSRRVSSGLEEAAGAAAAARGSAQKVTVTLPFRRDHCRNRQPPRRFRHLHL